MSPSKIVAEAVASLVGVPPPVWGEVPVENAQFFGGSNGLRQPLEEGEGSCVPAEGEPW